MNFMKRIVAVLATAMLVAMASACMASTAVAEQPQYRYSVLSPDQQQPTGVLTIPWNEDASKVAQETGTIRFYFMSGEMQNLSASAGIKFGDSCLIAFPNGEVMLIDAGMPNYAPTIVANLQALGVSRIDHLVLSHMHDDHYGALLAPDGVLAKFAIGTLYWSGIYNESSTVADRFDTALARYDFTERILSKGDSLDIGAVHLDILNPVAEEIGNRYVETALNNSSLAIKFNYDEFTALFAGDLYTDGEFKLIEAFGTLLDVDLVKANHHGRNTSNSKAWIQATTPRIVVATSGNPVDETPYAYYSRFGAYVFNDNLDGYVRVVSDGTSCATTTSRKRVTTYFEKYDKLAQSIYPLSQ